MMRRLRARNFITADNHTVLRGMSLALMLLGVLLIMVAFQVGAQVVPTSPTLTAAPTQPIEATPIPLLLTPIPTPDSLPALPPLTDSQSSKGLALYDNLLVTVNSDSDSLTLVDIATDSVLAEIPVGDDPRTVAITPDGTLALVTLRGDNALALVDLAEKRLAATYPIGHMPYGVVTDGRRAFVSCFADDQISVLDLETGAVLYRLDVRDSPAGLALSGEWLLATHFYSGYVTLLNVRRTPFVVGAVDAEPDGYLGQVIVLSPDGERAYIPQQRAGMALVSLQYKQDWFPVVSVLDVATMMGDRDARMTVSMIGDYAANMPFDVAFADDDTLYTVLAGNDAVEVIDIAAYRVQRRISVGANPRGVVIAGGRAFVLNALDGTLSVIDTASNSVTGTIYVTEIPLDPQVLQGKKLFHQAAAPTMSDGAISCATCHFDGGSDARTWINFRSGPRNTPALGDSSDTPPYHWAGDLGELQDSAEDTIRHVMLGDGLIDGDFDATIDHIDARRSADLDALVAYITSFQPWPSPYREADGSLSGSAQRGMMIFLSGSPDCSCHAPPLYTDLKQHNLAAGVTFSMELFGDFDTPTLRGIWATAPYMHDGVAQTLEEVLTRTDPIHSVAQNLTAQQLADLIAFLRSL